jgi:hypothetical protein
LRGTPHAERHELIVGEERMRAIGAGFGSVAGGAIALHRVIEQPQPALLGGGQGGLAIQEGVELAVPAVEAGVVELEPFQGARSGRESARRIGEDIFPECRLEPLGVGSLAQLADHVGLAGVGHLVRVEQGAARLFSK